MPVDHADVLRLQLVLGARCGEIAGMKSDEIDAEDWLWTLSADRSKNNKRGSPQSSGCREIYSGLASEKWRVFLP
jgi:integrase